MLAVSLLVLNNFALFQIILALFSAWFTTSYIRQTDESEIG